MARKKFFLQICWKNLQENSHVIWEFLVVIIHQKLPSMVCPFIRKKTLNPNEGGKELMRKVVGYKWMENVNHNLATKDVTHEEREGERER